MSLYSYLEEAVVKEGKASVFITGGGGKTTLMGEFGDYLKKKGYSVLITTTTKVASPRLHDYKVDRIFSDESVLGYMPEKGESVFYSERSFDVKKWISPRPEVIDILSRRYDVVLCEADGSRGLPFKYHTDRDPVVLDSATAVIGVCGLWGVGYKAYEMCFGDGSETIIDKEYIDTYLREAEGLTKGMREDSVNIVLFNGGDIATPEILDMIKSLNLPKNLSGAICSMEKDALYGCL